MHDCHNPLVKRLRKATTASIELTLNQETALGLFRKAVRDNSLTLSPNPCICGTQQDVVIACRDRYGLEVRTVLCRHCALMRTDPYLSPESITRFYAHHYRSVYVPDPVRGLPLFNKEVNQGRDIASFLAGAGIQPKRVFEVGCGSGGILHYFKVATGAEVVGCDLGADYLDVGRKKGLDLRHGSSQVLASDLPADLIVLSHVVEHFRDPVIELKQLQRMLTTNGYVYIAVPGLFWLKYSYRRDIARYLQNAHVYHFTLKTLDYLMAIAGFRRIAGTERIQALYEKDTSVIAKVDAKLVEEIIAYINSLERVRFMHQMLLPVKRLMRPIMRFAKPLS